MLGGSVYMRCFLTSLFVALSSFSVWAEADSTYTALVKDCVSNDFLWVGGYEWPSRKYAQYKRQALDLGYSEVESKKLLSHFEDETCPELFISYVTEYFAEELTSEDMRSALALFDTEQGIHATESLGFFKSDKFRKELTDTLLYDMADLIIEKKVTKKKCLAPKQYQKLFRSYMISSGWDDSSVSAAMEQLVSLSDNDRDELISQYFIQNLQTVMIHFFYRNVPMEDLRFLHDFSKSAVGAKFGRIVKKTLGDIGLYYELVDREFSSFLKKEYEIHPPEVLKVAPEKISVEEDIQG